MTSPAVCPGTLVRAAAPVVTGGGQDAVGVAAVLFFLPPRYSLGSTPNAFLKLVEKLRGVQSSLFMNVSSSSMLAASLSASMLMFSANYANFLIGEHVDRVVFK